MIGRIKARAKFLLGPILWTLPHNEKLSKIDKEISVKKPKPIVSSYIRNT